MPVGIEEVQVNVCRVTAHRVGPQLGDGFVDVPQDDDLVKTGRHDGPAALTQGQRDLEGTVPQRRVQPVRTGPGAAAFAQAHLGESCIPVGVEPLDALEGRTVAQPTGGAGGIERLGDARFAPQQALGEGDLFHRRGALVEPGDGVLGPGGGTRGQRQQGEGAAFGDVITPERAQSRGGVGESEVAAEPHLRESPRHGPGPRAGGVQGHGHHGDTW